MTPRTVGPGGDFRFLLPSIPASMATVGALGADRLAGAGVTLVDPAGADAVAASAEDAALAVATGAGQLVLFGRTRGSRRRLQRAGYDVTRWFPLGTEAHADGYVSPQHRRAADYAVRVWRAPAGRGRAEVLRLATAVGVAMPNREPIIVATRGVRPDRDAIVSSAGLELGPQSSWFLATPGIDAGSRVAAFLFNTRSATPQAVVKVHRSPGIDSPFAADDRGLGVVRDLGSTLTDRVPSILARGLLAGHHASVETAALGRPVSKVLLDERIALADRLHLVRAVARWTIELGRASARAGDTLAAGRQRLRSRLAGDWPELGPRLVDGLPDVPAVATHGDLGTWNILADGVTFTVLDWEAASPAGLPMSDLTYFLGDALALLGGHRSVAERTKGTADLFAGRSPHSALLFGLLEEAARSLGLERAVVAQLVVLSWLDHSVVPEAQRAAGRRRQWPAELLAERWLADPDLGPEWRAWR